MPRLPRRRRATGRRKVPAVPRDGARGRSRPPATEPIDWGKYAKGTTGGSSEVPSECQAKSDTGSADDMWIRTMTIKPPIPEEPTGPLNVHAIEDPPTQPDEYGYGG